MLRACLELLGFYGLGSGTNMYLVTKLLGSRLLNPKTLLKNSETVNPKHPSD